MGDELRPQGDAVSLADDVLRGVKPIAKEIGENERRTYYLLEKKAARPLLAEKAEPDIKSKSTATEGSRIDGTDQAQPIASIIKNSRESLRVSIDSYRDHDYIDLRLYADNGVEQVPTHKGLTIRPDLLPAVIEALHKAEAAARKAGLL